MRDAQHANWFFCPHILDFFHSLVWCASMILSNMVRKYVSCINWLFCAIFPTVLCVSLLYLPFLYTVQVVSLVQIAFFVTG